MGNFLDMLGGGLGWQEQQARQARLQLNGSFAAAPMFIPPGATTAGNVFTSDSSATFTIDSPYGLPDPSMVFDPTHNVKAKEETAVQWLNRRVEEMRVRL